MHNKKKNHHLTILLKEKTVDKIEKSTVNDDRTMSVVYNVKNLLDILLLKTFTEHRNFERKQRTYCAKLETYRNLHLNILHAILLNQYLIQT